MKLLLFALLVLGIAPHALSYEDYLSPISNQLDFSHTAHPVARRLNGQSKRAQLIHEKTVGQKLNHHFKNSRAKVLNQNSKSNKAQNKQHTSVRKLANRKSKLKHKTNKRKAKSSKHDRHHRKLETSSNMLTSILDPVSDQINMIPNAIGISPATDRQDKYLSALGTSLLGYGMYNYHARGKDFEAFRRKLFTNFLNREMYLDAVTTQVSQMHEVEMALNRCKNKARELQDMFNQVVFEKIKPGFGLH